MDLMAVTMDNFHFALGTSNPSAIREMVIQVPNVSWDDIGGVRPPQQYIQTPPCPFLLILPRHPLVRGAAERSWIKSRTSCRSWCSTR